MQIGRTVVVAPATRPGRRWRMGLASLAVVLAVASVPVVAWAVPAAVPRSQAGEEAEPAPPGEILADGRARLPEGEIAWTLRRLDVPGGAGLAVESFPTGFALVDSGSVALRAEEDEEPTEIGEGEAELLPDRKAGSLASVAAESASLYEIAIVSAEDAEADDAAAAVVGEPFPAPGGEAFEVALTANTLAGQDEATIPVSSSGAPTFYLTTEDATELRAGDQVVELQAGQFALLTGEVQIRAAGDAPATYVVATIEEASPRERGEGQERQNREDRGRQPRERAAGGGGGGGSQAGASDRGSRRAARQAARAAQQAQQGQGGRGSGGQGQPQSPGAPAPGGAEATVPAPAGTPGIEPTPEPTVPAEPTVPPDGTPPAAETPPGEEAPPAEETAEPTATTPPVEAPAEEPTVAAVPTNPPVPEVPEVPGVPAVPAEETVVAETAPEEAPPAEEAPAAPVEETPPADPAAEG